MALLYGQGDFQKTLDYSCAFGMDADNQAATMCGLLGIVNGFDSIPKDLMFPVKELNWTEPFNNFYKMVTREGLTDETLTNLAQRIAKQGKKIILAKGGEIIEKNDKKFYKINTEAEFIPPFELNPFPKFSTEVKHEFAYKIYTGAKAEDVEFKLSGNVPEALKMENGKLTGKPTKVGKYKFQLSAKLGKTIKTETIDFTVHSKNLASTASKILFNKNSTEKDIEIIRDGNNDKTYYSTKKDDKQEIDFYGYLWDKPQTISAIIYNCGVPNEFFGWFTSFDIEYLNPKGEWRKVNSKHIYPEMNLENNQWLKPNFIDYDVNFEAVETKAIRIIGKAGGIEKDAGNAHLGMEYKTAISELKIFNE